MHWRKACLSSNTSEIIILAIFQSVNCGKPQRVKAKFSMSATAKIQEIQGKMSLFVNSEDFNISYLYWYWLLKTAKFNSGGRDKSAAREECVTMLPGAWTCDQAAKSINMWPCYQEHDHVAMLPGTCSSNHSDYQPSVATHLFLWPSPNKQYPCLPS